MNWYYSTNRFSASLAGTTTDALTEGASNRYYTDARVNAYVHSSTTIAKTYANTVWTGLQTVPGVEFTESDSNPTCASGNYTIYADTSEQKLKKCVNGVSSDLSATGSDSQHAASYDTDEVFTNVTDTQVVLGTVSVTPTTATGDVYVTGQADVYSSNATDQPFTLVIETTTDCTGTTVGNANVTYLLTSGANTSNDRGSLIVSGIAVDPGAASQSYSLCASTAAGDTDVENWRIEALVIDTGADVAEIYTTNEVAIEAGDVVSYDPALETGVRKTTRTYDYTAIGVVSTKPGVVIGGVQKEGVHAVPVALSGRVPVKVSTENGPIYAGDYLTSSSIPGVAMKATEPGYVIGQSLDDFENAEVGHVLMFVKNMYVAQQEEDASEEMALDQTLREAVSGAFQYLAEKVAHGTRVAKDVLAQNVIAIVGIFEHVQTNEIEMRDAATGDSYCVRIVYGEWQKTKGRCVEKPALSANITPTEVTPEVSSTPVADEAPDTSTTEVAELKVEPVHEEPLTDDVPSEEIPRDIPEKPPSPEATLPAAI